MFKANVYNIYDHSSVTVCIPQPVEGRGREAERVVERRQRRGQLRRRQAKWEQRVRGRGQLGEVSAVTILVDVQQRMARPGLGLGQEAVTRLGGRVGHAGDVEGRGPGRHGGRGGGAGHGDEVTLLSLAPPSCCLSGGCLPGLLQEVCIRLEC